MKYTLKYWQLGDVEWLKDHYIEQKLTCTEIAALVGCSKDGVLVALRRAGIAKRTAGESIFERNQRHGYRSRKYALLNDREWLHGKYIVEKCSTEEIADMVNAKRSNSVRQALLRFGMPVRDFSDGQTRRRQDQHFVKNVDVINGCLLGDGFFRKYNKQSEVCGTAFYKRNKFYDHVLYVASLLFREGAADRIKPEMHYCNGKRLPYFLIRSAAYKDLNDMYQKWYPDGIKIVPPDLEMNETVLLHWFMDDGSTSWRKRRTVNSVRMIFCTQGFTKEDQQILCDKVNEKFDLGFSVGKSKKKGTGYLIRVSELKVNDFFSAIGTCPVPNMEYKWKTRHKLII